MINHYKKQMKRVILAALITIFALNNDSYGQILFPREDSNEKWGFVDESETMIIPYKYDLVDGFVEGLAAVRLDGKWGFIDKSDNVVIPMNYNHVEGFSEGLAKASLNGKYGFIDRTGKTVIPFKYDHAYGFSEPLLKWGPPKGFAMVALDGKYGFFDNAGDEVVPVIYSMKKASRKLNRSVRKR